MDWPDDTLRLMRRQVGPWPPFKDALQLAGQVRYPVTIPVLTDDVELYCPCCGRWNLVADWQYGNAFICPAWTATGPCAAPPASGHEYGEYERQATGLFTVVLKVPPRHITTVYEPERQAVNAIAACRAARSQARKMGLEVA